MEYLVAALTITTIVSTGFAYAIAIRKPKVVEVPAEKKPVTRKAKPKKRKVQLKFVPKKTKATYRPDKIPGWMRDLKLPEKPIGLRKVAKGMDVPPELLAEAINGELLTERERISFILCTGLARAGTNSRIPTSHEVAEKLGVTHHTVSVQRQKARRKIVNSIVPVKQAA